MYPLYRLRTDKSASDDSEDTRQLSQGEVTKALETFDDDNDQPSSWRWLVVHENFASTIALLSSHKPTLIKLIVS